MPLIQEQTWKEWSYPHLKSLPANSDPVVGEALDQYAGYVPELRRTLQLAR